ncbi:PIN domain-containing protein, partial [Picosynechococcus sp. PCC 7002]|uniref:PIN domain-containing protein n=2 Tax=Cyanobacteriota TaxID=1117 RepID=UPI0030DB7B39
MFLLDTNICIYIIKEKPSQVLEKFEQIEPHKLGISIITLAELEYGAAKSMNPAK